MGLSGVYYSRKARQEEQGRGLRDLVPPKALLGRREGGHFTRGLRAYRLDSPG